MHSHDIGQPTVAAPAPTRTRLTRRLLKGSGAALAALVILLTIAPPAQASSRYGQMYYEADCFDGTVVKPPQGYEATSDGSLIIRDTSKMAAGYLTFYHSKQCLTSWLEWWTWDSRFHGEISIWNNGGQNQKAWTSAGQTWSRTRMVDDYNGLYTCSGMQVYLNGGYRRWQPSWCW